MTRQEFDEAYDNGYKHGYAAGRNETTVGMTKKKIDILKRLRGKMDDDMLDTFYETKDEEREALSEAIKILDQGFDVDKHDTEVIKETVESIWGKPPYTDVLDDIRAEIENNWQLRDFPASPFSCGLRHALEIIDKYRGGIRG